MEDVNDGAANRARHLAVEIRAFEFIEADLGGEVLAIAAAIRCADLIEAMAKRSERDERDPLVGIGLRDVLETAINGLLFLAEPDAHARFAKRDINTRAQIASALGAADEFTSFLENYSGLDQTKQPWTFAERVDRVHAGLPGVFADDADAGRAKAMYGHLCNFTMHGGAGVLGDYLVVDGSSLRVVPTPTPLISSSAAVDLGTGFSHRLFERLKERRVDESSHT